MVSGRDFQAWNNHDRGGYSDSYTGAQGQDNLNANDNSLETAANTWVIIFDKPGYTGNCKKIPPSKYIDSLTNTNRYDNNGKKVGDWKNHMQSFILYKQKPAFWDTGSDYTQPDKSQLFILHDGQACMAENDDFMGANRIFAAPFNGPSTTNIGYTTNGIQMSGIHSISSLKTGPNAWLIIFSKTGAQGDFRKIGPNNTASKLSTWTRTDLNNKQQGNWENEIDSFLLYPAEPGFWSTKYQRIYVDFETFYKLYPDPSSKATDNDVAYVVGDSTYKIDEPEFIDQSTTQQLSVYLIDDTTDLPADGWTKYHVYQQHENTGSFDDKAEYDIYFDNNGRLVSIQRFQWSSKGAFQVPQTLIKSVDLVAWYIGTASSLVSFGVGEEVAATFVEIFDFVCNVFNKISNVVYKATDNGGQFYFLPVICHTLNRICTTVATPFNRPVYAENDPRNNYRMAFSNSGFPSELGNALNGHGSAKDWIQSTSGKTSTFNQVVEFTFQNNPYRTWYQESSISSQLGLFVSCKIDYEINNSKDDHIILLMGFAITSTSQQTPVISFAQVIVQFTDGSNTNIQSNAFNVDVINSVYNDLKSKLSNISMGDDQKGRQYIADITKANMIAMNACVSYH